MRIQVVHWGYREENLGQADNSSDYAAVNY